MIISHPLSSFTRFILIFYKASVCNFCRLSRFSRSAGNSKIMQKLLSLILLLLSRKVLLLPWHHSLYMSENILYLNGLHFLLSDCTLLPKLSKLGIVKNCSFIGWLVHINIFFPYLKKKKLISFVPTCRKPWIEVLVAVNSTNVFK